MVMAMLIQNPSSDAVQHNICFAKDPWSALLQAKTMFYATRGRFSAKSTAISTKL